jgi:hypothetical protein
MKTRILFYLVSAVILAGCATTQDFMVLDDRLTELETERVKTEQEQDQLDSRIVNFSKIQESKDQDFMGQYAGLIFHPLCVCFFNDCLLTVHTRIKTLSCFHLQ